MAEVRSRVLISPPICLDPASSDFAGQMHGLPSKPGVYVLIGRGGRPHIASCSNLKRRLTRMLGGVSSAGGGALLAQLREKLVSIEYRPTSSRLETSLTTYQLARRYFPSEYLKVLRLRMPWFAGVTLSDAFPRLTIQNRIPRDAGALFGPFRSRDSAQAYEESVLTLFQLRRCTETLAPSVDHPGCVYGEINQCLRPCQCAVTRDEYATEVRRVSDFLMSNGRTAIATLSAARDNAAEKTDFEQAAFLHKQVEKMKSVAALRDSVIGEVSAFHGLALVRGHQARNFRLWPMIAGYWQNPIDLDFSGDDSQSKSLDGRLRETVAAHLSAPSEEGRRVEHLALFSRWYFSSWRDGEWFPYRSLRDLNYRALVRQISAMVKEDAVAAP